MSASAKLADSALAIRTRDAPQRKQQTPSDAKPTIANTLSSRKRKMKPRNRGKTGATSKVIDGQIVKLPEEVTSENTETTTTATTTTATTTIAEQEKKITKKSKNGKLTEKKVNDLENAPTWKTSPFLGGRYLPLDPIFSRDEKFLIVAQVLSLKIYSTKTSLLIRAIALPRSSDTIVSYFLDSRSDDYVYIATSGSRLYLYNLVSGDQVNHWSLPFGPNAVRSVSICADQLLESSEVGVIYVVTGHLNRRDTSSVWHINLEKKTRKPKRSKIYSSLSGIIAIRVVDAGRAVCVISDRNIVIINANGDKWCEPRVYKMSNHLTCMDVHVPGSSNSSGKKSRKGSARRGGDIVVGDRSGALYVLHDIVKASKVEVDPTPMKLHWHRTAASSVKWALDGAYIVSGGLETVLVIWQLETGHKQFLPHLGAAINNVVISPRGSSYALSLSDNSIMTLSTAELKPKANIAGIQSTAKRNNSSSGTARTVPCILHPTLANSLLIAVPSNQLAQSASSPYLQIFDTYTDRHISRQALARTNITTVTQGRSSALSISEPNIVFLAVTSDGQWLASVDEWEPSKCNTLGEETSFNLKTGQKREIFLKFWKSSEPRKEWELATRVDTPHPCTGEMGTESILDLIAAPNGQAFVTVGSDGCVKIWKPKIRARPGIAAADSQVSWGCRKSINYSKQRPDDDALPIAIPGSNSEPRQWWGNVAFSADSSLLVVSCPNPGFGTRPDSLIHIIDPSLGSVRQTLGGLCVGRTSGLAIVDRFLVIAGSDKLLLWNLVHGGVQWEYNANELAGPHSPSPHLAVDQRENTFAVAFASKLIVWASPNNPSPVHTQDLDSPVAAIKSAGPGRGYMVLDAQARVTYVTPVSAAHASIASIVASGQEVEPSSKGGLSALYGAAVSALPDTMDVDEKEDAVDKVVTREALETVFDDFVMYEEGSVEAAFDRVLLLFAKGPLGKEEDELIDEGSDKDLD